MAIYGMALRWIGGLLVVSETFPSKSNTVGKFNLPSLDSQGCETWQVLDQGASFTQARPVGSSSDLQNAVHLSASESSLAK